MRWITVGSIVLLGGGACAASFDCARASSAAERLICSTPLLSSLDEELAEVYSWRRQEATADARLASSQRAWIRRRDECATPGCLQQRYEERVAELACLDGPAMGSAIGVATCARTRLRQLDRALDARDRAGGDALAGWRAERARRCREEGQAAGGAPGWQSASALSCEVQAAERRLAGPR